MPQLDFDCPECGPGVSLDAPRGPLRARCCPQCGGALLGPAEAETFRVRAGRRMSPALRSRGAIHCPSCAGPLPRGVVGETPYSPCSACGIAWIGVGAMLATVEDGLGGPRSQPAVLPRRRGRRLALPLAAAALVAAAGGAAVYVFVEGRPEWARAAGAAPPPAPAPAPVAAVAAQPPPAPSPAAPAVEPPPAPAKVPAAPAIPPFAAAAADVELVAMQPDQPKLILARRAGQRAALLVSFGVGSVDDGSVVGLTRLAQHALLAANAKLDAARLTLDLHAAGATLELRTGPRDAGFLLDADRRDFGALAGRVLDALLDPRLATERVGDATARALLDDASGPDLVQLVAQLAAEDTRYGNPAVGRRSEIESIDPREVLRHASRLSPAAATVVATGSFDRDELVRLVRRYRGGEGAASTSPRLAVPFSARRAAPRELNVVAHPLAVRTARDAAAARVAARVLDGLLWRRFRGAGVGYSHAADAHRTRWLDLLVVVLPAHDTSSNLGAALREVVRDVRRGSFTDAELERARAAVRGEMRQLDGDPAALASVLATSGPLWHGAATAREIEGLRREDLVNTVAPWLDETASVSLYLGPQP